MEIKNELKFMFTAHWKYLAVSTACKLNVFDAITEDGSTATILSEKLKLNLTSLIFLLDALTSEGFLTKENLTYSLTNKADYLTENHPESLKYACMNWSAEHLTAWQDLDYTVKTGQSSFKHIYSQDFFTYIGEDPIKLHNYHRAMFEYARDDFKQICNYIDFSKHKSIIDVGGGYGALISYIKANNPGIDCYLLDFENVVKNACVDSIVKISGNFFENIPAISDALVLSRILHDWDDEKALAILKNCYDALPKNGTIYIIENCKDHNLTDLSLLSLNMQIMCQSFERDSSAYKNLLFDAGFKFETDTKLNELQTILIFTKS